MARNKSAPNPSGCVDKWAEREDAIREMAKTMTDEQIGVFYGVTDVTIWRVRHLLGIPNTPRKRTFKPTPPKPTEPEMTYEENGVTVRRYPARYAETLSWGKVVR